MASSEGYTLCGYEELPQGPALCLRKRRNDDVAALSAAETAASIAVSAALLAAFTFLYGISLATDVVPIDLRGLLGLGLVSSTLSMLVYGKSSGELSRIRRGRFDFHMQSGNVLSEFGGYYVLLIATPVVLASVSNSILLGAALCTVSSSSLFWYHSSGIALIDRYLLHWLVRFTIKSLLAFSPLLALPMIAQDGSTMLWTLSNIVLLLALALYAWSVGGERVTKNHSE